MSDEDTTIECPDWTMIFTSGVPTAKELEELKRIKKEREDAKNKPDSTDKIAG